MLQGVEPVLTGLKKVETMPFKDRQKMRDFQREWRQNRKKAFFLGKKCAVKKCKVKTNLGLSMKNAKMDPRTARTPWSLREEAFIEEIKKYRVYCPKHLRKKWIANMKRVAKKTKVHGIYSTYRKGCRCNPCKTNYSTNRHDKYLRTKT